MIIFLAALAGSIIGAFSLASLIRLYKFDKYSMNKVPSDWTKKFWLSILIQIILYAVISVIFILVINQVFPFYNLDVNKETYLYGLALFGNILIGLILIVAFILTGIVLSLLGVNITFIIFINKCLKYGYKVTTLYKVLFTISSVILLLCLAYIGCTVFVSFSTIV